MGMTDNQFKAYVEELMYELIEARENEDWNKIKKLEERLQRVLER